MTKKELVRAVAEKSGFMKKDVAVVIDVLLDTIVDTVVSGDTVKIYGFGNFIPITRAAHEGVNPSTGEKMQIPESKNMKFSPSSAVKAACRG